jgi:hypothetical protein
MLTGAGKSINDLFTILINGCVVRSGLNMCLLLFYVMKVRNGPLDRDDIFTTITIVINRISVIIIRIYMLCGVNRLISWCDFVGVISV